MRRRPKGRTKTGTPTKTGTNHGAHKYTPSLGKQITDSIAQGNSLAKTMRNIGGPDASTVTTWVMEGSRHDCVDMCLKEFAQDFRRAREISFAGMADELLDIADKTDNDLINGRPNNAAVQRDKLAVDTRKYILSRMLPRVWGDQKTLVHEGNPDAPIEVNHRDLARTMIEVLGTQALEKVEKS